MAGKSKSSRKHEQKEGTKEKRVGIAEGQRRKRSALDEIMAKGRTGMGVPANKRSRR